MTTRPEPPTTRTQTADQAQEDVAQANVGEQALSSAVIQVSPPGSFRVGRNAIWTLSVVCFLSAIQDALSASNSVAYVVMAVVWVILAIVWAVVGWLTRPRTFVAGDPA